MKKYLLLFMVVASSFAAEQTICFSQEYTGSSSQVFPNGIPVAKLGDNVSLHGGKCDGRKLADMNKEGWRLVTVVTGLQSSFGMVFERGK